MIKDEEFINKTKNSEFKSNSRHKVERVKPKPKAPKKVSQAWPNNQFEIK